MGGGTTSDAAFEMKQLRLAGVARRGRMVSLGTTGLIIAAAFWLAATGGTEPGPGRKVRLVLSPWLLLVFGGYAAGLRGLLCSAATDQKKDRRPEGACNSGRLCLDYDV